MIVRHKRGEKPQFTNSGAFHNPRPSTPRGKRRAEARNLAQKDNANRAYARGTQANAG